jgi:hypothetical protein
MSNDDYNEDWYDDGNDQFDDEETAPCPECGGPVYDVTDKCPACGYWLSAADRRAIRRGERKPGWLVITAWLVLALFLIPIVAIVLAVIRRAGIQ